MPQLPCSPYHDQARFLYQIILLFIRQEFLAEVVHYVLYTFWSFLCQHFPIAFSFKARYKIKGLPCLGAFNTGRLVRYSLIFSKAFWHSSFYSTDWFFLKSLKTRSQIIVRFVMNLLMYCSFPINPHTSFSVFGTGIS